MHRQQVEHARRVLGIRAVVEGQVQRTDPPVAAGQDPAGRQPAQGLEFSGSWIHAKSARIRERGGRAADEAEKKAAQYRRGMLIRLRTGCRLSLIHI